MDMLSYILSRKYVDKAIKKLKKETTEQSVDKEVIKDIIQESEVNSDIWKVQGEVGAKNLLVYPYYHSNRTIQGIIFTDNKDGSVTVNGISDDNAYPYFMFSFGTKILPKGTYTFSISNELPDNMFVDIGKSEGYEQIANGFVRLSKDEKTKTFTVTEDNFTIIARIILRPQTTADNVTVYPMLRHAEDTDDTWQPYTLTNRELNERINDVADNIYKAQSILGAKNLLAYPYQENNITRTGITWAANSDGSVTINGQIESGKTFSFIELVKGKNFILAEGVYFLTCTSNIEHSNAHAEIRINDWNNKIYTSLAHVEIGQKEQSFIITKEMVEAIKDPSKATQLCVIAQVNDTSEAFDNITIYPMIRLATDTDNTWQPYVPTNKELAEQISANKNDLAPIIGEYLPISENNSAKKRSADVGATKCQFYAGAFLSKYELSRNDIVFDISAETSSGNVIEYNYVGMNAAGLITITFDELTEAATFVCKASKIN